MLVKHSLSITVSRFSLFYKYLLYISIMLLIFAAISISSMYYIMRPIIQGVQNMHFFEHVGNALKSMFAGDLAVQNQAFAVLGQDFETILEVFATNKNNVVGAVCAMIGFLFLGKFMFTIGHYSLADVLNNFMNSNSKFGFTSNLIANIKKAMIYSLFETLIFVLFIFVLGAISCLIGWAVGKFSFMIALSLIVVIAIALCGLRRSVFAMWLPTYINEDLNIFKSLQKAVVTNKDLIIKNWGLFSAVNAVVYMFTLVLSVVTFGLGFLLALSFINILYLSVELVIYYRRNERKYYIDAETVIDSKHSIKSVY